MTESTFGEYALGIVIVLVFWSVVLLVLPWALRLFTIIVDAYLNYFTLVIQ